jgi:hypothetical protein
MMIAANAREEGKDAKRSLILRKNKSLLKMFVKVIFQKMKK